LNSETIEAYLWWDLNTHTPHTLEAKARKSKTNMMFNMPRRKKSNVLQQPTLDKENIPPQVALASTTQNQQE
jgi:hypothetical protein